MGDYVLLFLRAYAVTLIIETAALWMFFLFLRRYGRTTLKPGIRILAAGIAASTLTHPLVWFVFPGIIEDRMWFLIVAELFAFAAEIPVIRGIIKTTWHGAAAASVLANGASFISGLLMGIS